MIGQVARSTESLLLLCLEIIYFVNVRQTQKLQAVLIRLAVVLEKEMKKRHRGQLPNGRPCIFIDEITRSFCLKVCARITKKNKTKKSIMYATDFFFYGVLLVVYVPCFTSQSGTGLRYELAFYRAFFTNVFCRPPPDATSTFSDAAIAIIFFQITRHWASENVLARRCRGWGAASCKIGT